MFHTSRHSATQRGLTLSIGTLRSQNAVRASLFRRREHVPIAFHSSISTFDKLTPRDDRIRLSQSWAPSGGITETADEDAHAKLIRAGFLRQAHSGIFHVLPLGRRVQDKLEKLVDKHMSRVGASKLALSSISSEEIWAKSGRLDSGSELFHFRDRKDVPYLLSPTHEEEITSLVAKAIKSYKELPIRLYQISRKYRDELRPRHGVLRSREFVMKDLYTFDYNSSKALATYHQVRQAYADFFDELKIPYLVAEADSGDMGGNLSHEFHFPTSKGEDHIISCTKCDYVANEELAESVVPTSTGDIIDLLGGAAQVWSGVTHDRRTLIRAWYLPSSPQSKGSFDSEINIYAIKNLIPDLDASVEDPELLWIGTLEPQDANSAIPNDDTSIETPQIVDVVDGRLLDSYQAKFGSERPIWPAIEKSSLTNVSTSTIYNDPQTNQPLNLLRIKEGDACPRCSTGTLKVQKAIELGHTFHLGTRYSEPLEATVSVPVQYLEEENKPEVGSSSKNSKDPAGSSKVVAMQMGCHGIGISRMIGAVADTLADERGLNWPRVMAPFEAVIVPGKDLESAALEVYDALKSNLGGASPDSELLDVVLDDRGVSFPWKMRDADLVGYPVIVVVGRRWKGEGMCEVQCRRLGIKEDVPIEKLQEFVQSLLVQL